MNNGVAPLLEQHFSHQGGASFAAAQVRVHDAFVVRYSASRGQSCHLPLHCDESTLSFTLSLNAAHGDHDNDADALAGGGVVTSDGVSDSESAGADASESHGGLPRYSGGGTYFAALRRAVRPKMGCCALFDGRALHGGAPTTAGTRYILAAFLYLDTGLPRHLKLTCRQVQRPRQAHAAVLWTAPDNEENAEEEKGGGEDAEEDQEEEREPWEEEATRQKAWRVKRPRLLAAGAGDSKEAGFSFGFSF
jgi:hypothetical protein